MFLALTTERIHHIRQGLHIIKGMIFVFLLFIFSLIALISPLHCFSENNVIEGLPLYYWKHKPLDNFGDLLSLKVVERIVGKEVRYWKPTQKKQEKKLLSIGSVLILARDGDVIWGTGMNGKRMDLKDYKFTHIDIRAVRGPMTRLFIKKHFDIDCPEVYGDPALLIPYIFPEFQKAENPEWEYIFIPHYKEEHKYPKELYPHVVHPTEPWDEIIKKILNSRLVIGGSLHALIVADAYGIPARYVRTSDYEPLFKYQDYYLSTNRPDFQYATSIEEGLQMGGEKPMKCDLEALYNSFPFEFWPNSQFPVIDFSLPPGYRDYKEE